MLYILQLVLIILKLAEVINWSWMLVFSPVLITLAVVLIATIIMAALAGGKE